jgi:hypothetical protein
MIKFQKTVSHPAENKTKKSAMPTSDQSILWGWPVASWDRLGLALLLAGAGLGVLALLAGLASSIILNKVANIAQSELAIKTGALDKATEELRTGNLALEAQVAEAKRDLAQANKSTEEIRAANLALEKQVAPRRLDADQMNAIVSALSPYAGKRVRLESYVLDVESAVLGKLLGACLTKAGLVVDETGMMNVQSFGRASFGLHISGEQPLVTALAFAFSNRGQLFTKANSKPSHGVSIVAAPSSEPLPSDALVFIGVKPIDVPVIEIRKK